MLYRLHILSGPLKGQQITVLPEPMTVGQGADCALAIPDAELAQHHAVFEHRDEGLFVRDLDTIGRLLVNHHETRAAKLAHGDTVELGRTLLLVQAVVQADAPSHPHLGRARRLARWLALLLMLTTLTVVAVLWFHSKTARPKVEPPHRPDAQLAPPPAVAANTPPAEQLRQMREELEIVRESIKLLTARTQATPAVASAPAQPVPAPPQQPAAAKPNASVSSLRFRQEKLAAHPSVRLVSTEQQRLPEHAEFDELRLLHIALAPADANPPPPAAVSIKTEFFDEDVYAGQIVPTDALCPRGVLHPEAWTGATPVTLTASYAVPLGTRDRQLLKGRKLRYCGYRVRVYAGTELQAEELHPRWLLDGKF